MFCLVCLIFSLGLESSAFYTCILWFHLSSSGLSKNEKHQNFLFLLVLVVPPMQEMLGWLHRQSFQTGRIARTDAQTAHRHGFIVVFLSRIYIDRPLQFAYLSPISPGWEPGFSYRLNQEFFATASNEELSNMPETAFRTSSVTPYRSQEASSGQSTWLPILTQSKHSILYIIYI